MFESAKVLLISDNEEVKRQIRPALKEEDNFLLFEESRLIPALDSFKENNFDCLFIDSTLGRTDIVDAIREFKKIDPDCAIIMLYLKEGPELFEDLSGFVIYDFLKLPAEKEVIALLARKAAQFHTSLFGAHKLTQGLKERAVALEKQNTLLAKRIEESAVNLSRLYEDLRSTYMRTIKVLAQAIDARDHYTHSHSQNVSKISVAIAEEMDLPVKDIESIREACELHDLGKIGVEDSILTKPSGLNAQEWEQVKRHPVIGAQILEPLTFLSDVIDLVKQHHEHYDGSGYPEGRKGEDILLGARIIHLADAYEAMTSARSYRKVPFSKEAAIEEIKNNSATQFDPRVVEVFLRIVSQL